MRKLLMRCSLLFVVATGLSGCAWMGLGKGQPQITAMSTIPDGDQAFHQFEAGRSALALGNYAEAISAFSSARMEPALLAPSLNGMGVAYVHLGREDIAERYFLEAIRAAPADQRFAANLARLQNRQSESLRIDEVLAAAEPVDIVTTGGQIHLKTSGMDRPHLAAGPATHTPVRIGIGRAQVTSVVSEPPHNGAQMRLRFASSDSPREPGQASYPVRVAIQSDTPALSQRMSSEPASRGYPVRVQLAK